MEQIWTNKDEHIRWKPPADKDVYIFCRDFWAAFFFLLMSVQMQEVSRSTWTQGTNVKMEMWKLDNMENLHT